MSGLVGIVHRDGEPVDRSVVARLTSLLAFRGSDAEGVWCEGAVGLGHVLLQTTQESAGERQPAELDHRLWIIADARIDARAELLGKLNTKSGGRNELTLSRPDVELILHAYDVWGDSCVDHLRGDFAFAIWDAHARRLFCARDHFGIKPFYYASLGDLFIFSNTLNCVRSHTKVSGELNDAAIGDFLLFGLNWDLATTSFRDVRRLPPAHCATVSLDGIRVRRYWSPPVDGRIRYKKNEEYVEHFRDLLRTAVSDRLRTEPIGILLSGGLDSCSLAAIAKEISTNAGSSLDLRTFTFVYDSLIPDNEGPLAAECARFLGISNRSLAMDGLRPFEGWDHPEWNSPEPVDEPFFGGIFQQFRLISSECRVAFSGEGSDNLMFFQMWPYVKDLGRNGEWKRLLTELSQYVRVRPSVWPGIRRRLKGLYKQYPAAPIFPKWIEPDFARRANLKERWEVCATLPSVHRTRPKAHASLAIPQWPLMFELQNSGVTRVPVEVRYPFLDLELVNYLLALPAFPVFFQKKLLRDAMRGMLPENIRVRAKTPLQGSPLLEDMKKSPNEWLNTVRWNHKIAAFVSQTSQEKLGGKPNAEQVMLFARPYCLNFWLNHLGDSGAG